MLLDIDLDYFLDFVTEESPNERVDDSFTNVWEEKQVIAFFEQDLHLSKNKKIPGRIVQSHDGAIPFWKELIDKRLLKTPFEIVHIDSHSDLGYLYTDNMDDITDSRFDISNRYNIAVQNNWINEGNYLYYAISFGWVKRLVYLANKAIDCLDTADELFIDKFAYDIEKRIDNKIIRLSTQDKPVDFTFCKDISCLRFEQPINFITFACSPKYTPKNADYIIDLMKEYIEEI